MNDWLLDILVCPLSREKLLIAEPALVEQLVVKQKAGQLFSHKGIKIEQTFDSGLVNQSHTRFYPISNSIPSLLPDEAISLQDI